jgi:hypothetical protein
MGTFTTPPQKHPKLLRTLKFEHTKEVVRTLMLTRPKRTILIKCACVHLGLVVDHLQWNRFCCSSDFGLKCVLIYCLGQINKMWKILAADGHGVIVKMRVKLLNFDYIYAFRHYIEWPEQWCNGSVCNFGEGRVGSSLDRIVHFCILILVFIFISNF